MVPKDQSRLSLNAINQRQSKAHHRLCILADQNRLNLPVVPVDVDSIEPVVLMLSYLLILLARLGV